MLVIADPVFNSNDARAKGVAPSAASAETRGLGIESALTDVTGQGAVASAESAKMQGLPLARLSGTRTEAQQIAVLGKASGAPTDVWLDLDASEANIGVRDITQYRVLHIADSRSLERGASQFTGVVLSLVGNKVTTVFSVPMRFSTCGWDRRWFLSACETGLGKEKRGEGVMGLTRAFPLRWRSHGRVSLWSVADKSTADLMTDFYKALLSSPAASTGNLSLGRNARRALAMITGKKYSAPSIGSICPGW